MARYGGNPMDWLARTPRGVVRAHLVMLDRLDAQESLLMAQRIAVGTGSLKGNTGRQWAEEWALAGRGESAPEPRTGPTPPQVVLGRIGIGVRKTRKVKQANA